MDIYFLFTNVNNEYICKHIYTNEGEKVFGYSYDEGYIVKNEETAFASLKEVETHYAARKKGSKKGQPPMLLKKEFPDVKNSLFYLNGNLDNYNNGIPARKRLPEIISPYDMDFEEKDDFEDYGERGFEETHGDFDKTGSDLDDDSFKDDSFEEDDIYDNNDVFKDDFDDEGPDDYNDDDDDDDFYRGR